MWSVPENFTENTMLESIIAEWPRFATILESIIAEWPRYVTPDSIAAFGTGILLGALIVWWFMRRRVRAAREQRRVEFEDERGILTERLETNNRQIQDLKEENQHLRGTHTEIDAERGGRNRCAWRHGQETAGSHKLTRGTIERRSSEAAGSAPVAIGRLAGVSFEAADGGSEGWYNPHRRHSSIDYLSPVKMPNTHPTTAAMLGLDPKP
jgi:plasmid stability protein